MSDEVPSTQAVARSVGPPVLLGQRPRFLRRAVEYARKDERIRALMLWGALARGDADEWSGIDFVAVVSDEMVTQVLDDLSQQDSLYGRSLVTLNMSQNGVDRGGVLSVTYL